VLGDLAFVGGLSRGYFGGGNIGVRIVDLSDPGDPRLVSRIPLRSQGFRQGYSVGDAVATHLSTASFEGDVAIVLDGVPDQSFDPQTFPEPHGIWDVTDPAHPTFLSGFQLGTAPHTSEGGDLGDKPFDARAAAGNYFYALYQAERRRFRFAVVDIADPRNPVVVGDWQDDGRVALLGLSVNEAGTRAYVTGVFPSPWGDAATHGYVYVLDTENPTQPTELGRYVFPLRGLISSMFKAAATDDGAYVVFADGSWEDGACGILHILDTSDLTAIEKVSEFALPESSGGCGSIATDVVIRGDMVYSTWLDGGVRAVDISDPINPVETASFQRGWLSDVALLGEEHVLASTVWDAGMYVLRPR
jgi:hypothetical protein